MQAPSERGDNSMGRFSPTVTPVPNDGLANALGNFTESYIQFSARKRQKDLDALNTGLGLKPKYPGTPDAPHGMIAALKDHFTDRTDPNAIYGAVQNAAPAVYGANAVNAGVAENLSRSSEGSPPAAPGGFVESNPTSGGNYAMNERPTASLGSR